MMNSLEMSRGEPSPGPLFVVALASVALINPLAVHLFLPVIPAVKAAFDVSAAVAQLTFSIALFVMAVATLVYGSLADRYGRRPVLLSGLCLFLIGNTISHILCGFDCKRDDSNHGWRDATRFNEVLNS